MILDLFPEDVLRKWGIDSGTGEFILISLLSRSAENANSDSVGKKKRRLTSPKRENHTKKGEEFAG